jgi:hypothetical protein
MKSHLIAAPGEHFKTQRKRREHRMSEEEQRLFETMCKEAGRHIDPATAEVEWVYGETLDPYGIHDMPEELRQVGREYFARCPDSEAWVHFSDLPPATANALWEMHKHKLLFPAGLKEAAQQAADTLGVDLEEFVNSIKTVMPPRN